MKMNLKSISKLLFRKTIRLLLSDSIRISEKQLIATGRLLSNQIKEYKKIKSIHEVEFSIFSQFGDDGIIQWLIHQLDVPNKTFIEFGVENYLESNTRFLLINNNWSGLVMDGSEKNIQEIESSYYYWKYGLQTKAIFITKDNINQIIKEADFPEELGLLHIDIDGNDYYIWDAITVVKPIIVIMEYNSIFGNERPISIPYSADFYRTEAHYSNLLWGASIQSLNDLAISKGYSFVGCNSAGNNAYFVRNDKLNNVVTAQDINQGFVDSKYRESRDHNGRLSFLSKQQAKSLIQGSTVFNTRIKENELF